MKTTSKGVEARTFVGIMLTPEIKPLLNQSREWRETTVLETKHGIFDLHVIDYHNKEYLGIYLEQPISMNELKMIMLLSLDKYKLYFPETPIDVLKLSIFPQIFIS